MKLIYQFISLTKHSQAI